MLFSSPIFLFLFLPLTLLGYFLSPKPVRNYWLLLSSLIFFAWGGVSYSVILIGSVIVNYFFGLLIGKYREAKQGRFWLIAGVSCNIALLSVFKYADFFIKNLNDFLNVFTFSELPAPNILLPIGISFYTFHALSYLIDIYRGKTAAQKNIFDLALYICMFSQLIAGPIIRYSDIWQQLRGREHSLSKFSSGAERFIIGLGKKVLLANTFAKVADASFAANSNDLGFLNAWLGILCYTFQIYCDFGGYSDMAIGLGRMFGFDFKENFNFPYLATSVKDFWRRWHISLSSFFRDYVYIPLGGNRVKTRRMYFNLVLVFFLTGFWHGASWSFVIWGLFHGVFMLLERVGFEKVLVKMWRPIANLYSFLAVMMAWVLFRADNLSDALNYWKAMFSSKTDLQQVAKFVGYLNTELVATLVITLLGSFGFFALVGKHIKRILESNQKSATSFAYLYHTATLLVYACILVLCSTYLIAGTYNPFIYYQF